MRMHLCLKHRAYLKPIKYRVIQHRPVYEPVCDVDNCDEPASLIEISDDSLWFLVLQHIMENDP